MSDSPERLAPTLRDDVPLQLPGRDEVLKRTRVAGPETKQDIRVYYDTAELRYLLDLAENSPSGRVELVMAGLECTDYRARSGHVYQVWKIKCLKAQPERPAILQSLGLSK